MAQARFLASIAVSMLWTFLYVVAAVQVGELLLNRIRVPSLKPKSPFEDLNLSFLLGLALLSAVITLLGLLGMLGRYVLVSLLLVSAVALAIRIWLGKAKLPAMLLSIKSNLVWIQPTAWTLFSLALVAIIAVYGLFSLVQPVSGDAEAYYMTLPKVMAYSQRLVPLRNYYSFSMITWFGELHFAALHSISGVMSAKFLVWFLYLSIAAAIHSLSVRMGHGLRSQITAQALLFTSSTVTFYIAGGKVDLFAAAFGLAAFVVVLEQGKPWLVRDCFLAGLLIGFSTVSKMTYAAVMYLSLLPVFAIPLLLERRRISFDDMKTLIIRGVTIAAFSSIAFVPHLVKNLVLFGEPFAPFAYLQARPEGGFSLQQPWFSPEATRYIVMTYPLQLFFGRFPLQEGTLSPLVLALLPIGLLRLRKNREKMALSLTMLTTSVLSMVVWVVIRPSWLAPRYILAPLLLIVPIAGGCLEPAFSGAWRKGGAAFILAFLCAGLAVSSVETRFLANMRRTASALVRGKPMTSYFEKGISFLNQTVPEGARVFVDGWYTYYMRPDILACMSEERQRIMQIPTHADLLLYLRQGDFRYIYVEKSSASKLLADLQGFPAKRLYDDEKCTVYRLEASGQTVAITAAARKDDRGRWTVIESR